MIDTWKTYLTSQGAQFDGTTVQHFGNAARELDAAASDTIVADLSQLGVVAFSGDDTAAFLQGQLTNDVRTLHADSAQWNGYCTPKGRLLGNFLMWRQGDDTCLQMAGDIVPSVQKRLTMFILRAKVKARDASGETVRLVVAGPVALAAVEAAMGGAPTGVMQTLATESGWVVRVGNDKFVLSVSPTAAPAVWEALARYATPVGAPVWDWLRLNAGIPMIVTATQEQFVPQMVNLEAIGGVSFQKGCYPGQEIVARSQYLGKMKRRMFLAHVAGSASPGDALYSADIPGQATGMIVNAAPAPGGGSMCSPSFKSNPPTRRPCISALKTAHHLRSNPCPTPCPIPDAIAREARLHLLPYQPGAGRCDGTSNRYVTRSPRTVLHDKASSPGALRRA